MKKGSLRTKISKGDLIEIIVIISIWFIFSIALLYCFVSNDLDGMFAIGISAIIAVILEIFIVIRYKVRLPME